ncbi:MAG: type I-U CRISPR-associated protein Cas7 [Verrucomicrobiota bacterium]|nr:type I-U CRISPR-associated protein Cas7 [Limisphaera sp.]MDW8382880.1 type I-U CRISPR-associated protein Cas7 [Verrucomicrobiota bacterium]
MSQLQLLDLNRLREAVTSAAAFRCRRKLQPAGGPGDKVFPPTFAGAVYGVEKRQVPGREAPVTCVLLDSVQSQANRMELALQEALDAGRITLPLVVVDFTPWSPDGNKPQSERLLDAVGKITSLQVPHRLADAILRDSQIEDPPGSGRLVEFRRSSIGKKLDAAGPQNATPLFELCPTALIFGMWDSTGPKGGLGAKFERAMVSEIVGIGASLSDLHKNWGVRRDPLEISKSVPLRKSENGSWEISADPKAKDIIRPSEVNHSSIPFESSNGGVTLEYAEQITTLSLIVLRRLRFPINGQLTPEADRAARTVLAALGLCAATLAFENGAGLRSRCLLWPEEPMTWELLAKPGEEPQRFTLTSEEAVKLFEQAVLAATKTQLPWNTAPVVLQPQPKLVKLVRESQELAVKSGPENSGD